MKITKGGFFATFESGERCGKTTHHKMLVNRLKGLDYKVFPFREPGSSVLAEGIRGILLDPRLAGRKESFLTDFLLFASARCDLHEHQVGPALESGAIALGDRCIDSSKAYQGYAGGLDLEMVDSVNNWVLHGRIPDRTYLIDKKPDGVSMKNIAGTEYGKKDKYERKRLDFHIKVYRGYMAIAKDEPDRVKIIPFIPGDIKTMHEMIWHDFRESYFKKTGRKIS